MNQNQWDLESQNDLGYGQLFAKLWHRRLLLFGVAGSVLAISVPLSLMKQPIYQSYMQILLESNYQGKQLNSNSNEYLENKFADTNVEVDYATQLRVLRSSHILNKVIERLGLNKDEETNKKLLEELRRSLSVYRLTEDTKESKTGAETNIIQTVYTGDSPTETKKVLETIQQVYLEYNLEQQEKRLKDGLAFINQQIPKARQELTEVESAQTQLSKENNLISPEDEAIAIKNNIRAIEQERADLKAQTSQIEGDYTSIQNQLKLSPANALALSRLSQSPRYQNLLNSLQTIEINLATERAKFTQDSPIVQNLMDKRDAQKALLVNEAEKILGQLPPNFLQELDSLQKQRQLVETDNNFVNRMTDAQSKLSGIRQRDLTLAQTKAELERQLTEFPTLISQSHNLTQQTQIKREALQRLLEAKQELEIELSRGGFNWQIIEPPQIGEKIGPNLIKDLLLNLIVASFLGVTAVFIRETTDERITTLKQFESETSLPILGTTPRLFSRERLLTQIPLPFLASSAGDISLQKVVESQSFRESLDCIYENLRLANINSAFRSLAVSSAVVGEGKSTFTVGLALSIARNQQRVLLIDGDLRCPILHKLFALNNQSGLSNFLAGEIDRPDINQVSFLGETINFISSGSTPNDPVKLLSSNKLQDFIDQQKSNYDLILIDTPPVLGMVDATKIASICDSSVLVMRADKTKVSELTEAISMLSRCNVLGIVANDFKQVTAQYQAQSRKLLPQQV